MKKPSRARMPSVPDDPIEADRIYRQALRAELARVERDRFRAAIASGGDGLRKIAEQRLEHGSCLIIAAFNLAHDPDCPYQFDEAVAIEAKQAILTLIRLMKSPIHQRAEAFAAGDVEFQRFLLKAL